MSRRLTREQAAIVGAYTGFLAGPFSDVHEYAERLFGRPVFNIELASLHDELSALARPDFEAIAAVPASPHCLIPGDCPIHP